MTDFCWLDLKTHDVAGTAEFFSAALGWRFAVDEQDWRKATKIYLGDFALGGVSDLANPIYPAGTPPHLAFYLTVDDVDHRTAVALDQGAQLVAGPFDAGDQGRLSTLLDPAGAAVSFWEAGEFHGWPEPPGRLVLPCPDPAAARDFYERVLGEVPPSAEFVHGDSAAWELALPVDDPGSGRVTSPEGIGFRLVRQS
ncbi:VOC family protein [Amycolatopsis lurida]